MMPSIAPIDVSSLARPNRNNNNVFRFGSKDGEKESDFFDAYQGLLNAAKTLASGRCFQDAYLNLNFSIESFFKYLFCIVRHDVNQQLTIDAIHEQIPGFYRRVIFQKSENLHAQSFGHNLINLCETIKSSTTIGSTKNFKEFLKDLKRENDNSWVGIRYTPRLDRAYETPYKRRLELFENLLNSELRGLK